MGIRLRMGFLAQLRDQLLDEPGLGLRGDEYGIRGRDDDDVVDADHRSEVLALAMDQAAPGLDEFHAAAHSIAQRITRQDVPDRIPGADIGPGEGDRQDSGAIGPLHHRVIDGGLRRAGEGGGIQAQEIEIARRLVEGRACRGQDLRT